MANIPEVHKDVIRTALITYEDYCKRQVNRAKLFQVKKIWDEELKKVVMALEQYK